MMEPDLSTYASNFKLAAYQSVSVHGGVANADPHAMVLMLMDAASERIATARGCIERGEIPRQARLLRIEVRLLPRCVPPVCLTCWNTLNSEFCRRERGRVF